MTGFTPTEDKLSRLAMKVFDKVGGEPLGLPTDTPRGAAVCLMCDPDTDTTAYYVTNGRMGSLTGIRLGRGYADSLTTLRTLWQGAEVAA